MLCEDVLCSWKTLVKLQLHNDCHVSTAFYPLLVNVIGGFKLYPTFACQWDLFCICPFPVVVVSFYLFYSFREVDITNEARHSLPISNWRKWWFAAFLNCCSRWDVGLATVLFAEQSFRICYWDSEGAVTYFQVMPVSGSGGSLQRWCSHVSAATVLRDGRGGGFVGAV